MDTLFLVAIINYIQVFASAFAANHFIYFRGFMLAFLLLGETRKCVTNMARACFFVNRHVSSWERFLSQYQWDITEVRRCLVALLKERLRDKLLIYGAYLADTTLVAKVKGKMPGVQKWNDHSGNPDRGEHLIGHHWALAGCSSHSCWELVSYVFPCAGSLAIVTPLDSLSSSMVLHRQ